MAGVADAPAVSTIASLAGPAGAAMTAVAAVTGDSTGPAEPTVA
jgi:hypothetical protein